MRWFKSLLKGLSFSTMAASAVALAGGVGCGDETFKFCECKYGCTANYTDAAGMPAMTNATLTVCNPVDDANTYGDCGVFCNSTFPDTGQLVGLETVQLGACLGGPAAATCYDPVPGVLGAPTTATLTGCAPTPTQTLAKNSCSPGVPVGE